MRRKSGILGKVVGRWRVKWREFEVRKNQACKGRRLGECQVKWREFDLQRKSRISKNRGWKVISDKWSEGNMKWGEDQLKAVKGRELRRGGMWNVYKGSEVDWGVCFGEMCVIECCIVWFTDCLVYLVVFNTHSSTVGSTRYCVWCVLFYCILLYFIVLSCLAL